MTASEFYTRSACTSLGGRVKKGDRYYVFLDVKEAWKDGKVSATPKGLPASDLGVVGSLGAPLRRILDASYMQPLIAIRVAKRRDELLDRRCALVL